MTTRTTLHLPIAITFALALAGCNDKPAATSAPAATSSTDAATPAASAPTEAPADASPGKGLTAREMISAPRGSVPVANEASADAAPEQDSVAARAQSARENLPAARTTDDRDDAASARDATAGGATDGVSTPRYAEVISVQPVKQKTMREREECRDERIVHRHRPKDDHQIAGTVIGAVAGGVIGHQVGGGRGRDLATVAGAVGGGYAGKKIQQGQQDRDTYTTTERRCRTIKEPGGDTAYDVVYEYRGQTHQVRLDHDPGERVELPVRGIE